jgi:hypothetical protein
MEALAFPLQPARRITRDVLLQELFKGSQDGEVFFFHRRSPGPRLTNATIKVEVIKFAAALGNGVDTEAGNAGHVAVTAIAQLLGLQPCIQATLPLVEGADEEIDLGVERLGRMGLRLLA